MTACSETNYVLRNNRGKVLHQDTIQYDAIQYNVMFLVKQTALQRVVFELYCIFDIDR